MKHALSWSELEESELKKKPKTYNSYDLRLSWGQLQAIIQRLENDHADAIADELYAELTWMVDNAVPGPGEEEADLKAREEQEKELADTAHADQESDFPLPMPPGEEGAQQAPEEGADLESPPEEGSFEGETEEPEPEPEPDLGPANVGESVHRQADRLLASPA